MAHVIPFQGTLYDPRVVSNPAQVVAPPYDVIDAAHQEALYARHPHNVIRLEFGKESERDTDLDNRYTRAAATLRDWLTRGVLRRDQAPGVYPYTIEYRVPSGEAAGRTRVLKGFLAVTALEEFGTGRIFPHENTRAAAKTDRLRLLEACRANFSPIFCLFSDPSGGILQVLDKAAQAERPRVAFQDDAGYGHRLWALSDRDLLHDLTEAMQPKPLFIADGHHRYETALTYRRLRREAEGNPAGWRPYDGVLMLCSSLEDPGLTVLPTHRALSAPLPPLAQIKAGLQKLGRVDEFAFQPGTETKARTTLLRALRERGREGYAFALAIRQEAVYLLLTLDAAAAPPSTASARDRLDVSILHGLVMPAAHPAASEDQPIRHTKDEQEALEWVRRGEASAVWILNPTKVSEVRDVAAAGDRMPHKSTYFYPKPLTGLVLNVMEPAAG